MSIQSQINAAPSGSVVTIAPGTYAEAVTIGKALTLVASGVVKIRPPASAWNAVTISAHNVTIDGFDIAGAKGDGIEANGVHHVTVRRCAVSGCGESGIQTNQCDYVTIEDNTCSGNARNTWCSGISLYENRNLAPATAGFRNVVRGNRCFDNVTLPAGGPHTDGNGIIIDDFQSTQASGFPNYIFPTLVENNLCYGNGGKGIQVTWADNVTVRRNTCTGNNRDTANDGTWRGDISISQSKGAVVENNIAVCVRGSGRLASNRAYGNTATLAGFNTTTWSGNIGWDATGTPSIQSNDGQASPVVTWVNPLLGPDYVPALASAAGWRPAGMPEPEPEPEEPTLMEIAALLAALQATLANVETRLAALEARPTDPEIAARVASAEAELARLDGRLDKIAGAASD